MFEYDNQLEENDENKSVPLVPNSFKAVMAMMGALNQPAAAIQPSSFENPTLVKQAPQPEPIPSTTPDMTPERHPASKKTQDTMDMGKFLKIIGQIESSSGRNFGHEELQRGMHKGHRAIGTYGLMPNTVDDIIKTIKDAPPHIKAIAKMSPEQKKQFLEANPQYEEYFARHLAKRVMNKYKSPEKAAYAWHHGHYTNPKKIDNKRLQSEYVQKFRKIRQGLAKRDPNSK